MIPRAKVVYENCSVLDVSGRLLFRAPRKRLDWYLMRGLATRVDDTTIRLTFQNKGTGRQGEQFYLQDMRNECVVCGATSCGLTMHHVVPHQYRQHMPDSVKSRSSHDLLPLCIACHDAYERHATVLKMHLRDCFDAPLDGRGWIVRDDCARGKRAAAALLDEAKVAGIPPPQIDRLREAARLAVDAYRDVLAPLMPPPSEHPDPPPFSAGPSVRELSALCALPLRERGPDYVSHGEIVVAALAPSPPDDANASGDPASAGMCADCSALVDGGVAAFVAAWRAHFLRHAQPRRLPEHWDPNYPIRSSSSEGLPP
ncbi:hypothetical protein H4217_006237 [Coemansia sp. RSA 1939]|nr:hypothetical protein H4217_006237 [Coemansia sp. RSA 1939]KAJ2608437.1 hypothetical protein EV177_004973 [Coemansia sp. RSA 1804]